MADAQLSREINDKGEFVRQESHFRLCITPDGSSGFKAEPGRYHIYVSYACPWASRAIIMRMLKGLDEVISMSAVNPVRDERGWAFTDGFEDPVNGFKFLSEAYLASDPNFEGRVTVPTVWDRETEHIVCNESAEVIRMLNYAFNEFTDVKADYYPEDLVAEIDEVNDTIYHNINNGVYKAGFATSQRAYDASYDRLFKAMGMVEERLSRQRYLIGDQITEADWRLFTTLVRFDSVYYSHFKCNKRRLVDYPNLWAYTRELYQQAGIADTVKMDQIKDHYYITHSQINPTGIVPKGPDIDFNEPVDRSGVG